MAIEAVQVGVSWRVVDKGVPGWQDLETHSSEAAAAAAVRRLQAARGKLVPLVSSERQQQAAQGRQEVLAGLLKGKAGDVRARVGRVTASEDLAELARLEQAGLGRPTVLSAIEAQHQAARISSNDRVTGA